MFCQESVAAITQLLLNQEAGIGNRPASGLVKHALQKFLGVFQRHPTVLMIQHKKQFIRLINIQCHIEEMIRLRLDRRGG
jgi:hypothetical protein